MNHAIEIVLFHAKPGVTPEQMQAAAESAKPVIAKFPGFISREFGHSDDGQYVDLVHWKDMDSAKNAAEQVMAMPELGDFFSLIDESRVQMLHFHSTP